jgi:hypothetical protein
MMTKKTKPMGAALHELIELALFSLTLVVIT